MESQEPSSLISPSLGLCQPKQGGFPSATANILTQEKDRVPDFLALFTSNYPRLESETRNFLYPATNSYIMHF